ncbi:hypothetical protein EsDP_00005573 [Epichloe bromicola]|uniref:Chromosome segregation in meiosis protein n=1 Tax=Epichloe bromicola TaxID=79588 RepID=A0ABQ0CV38_9HYPO
MSTLLSAGQLPPNRHDDLDNYGIDEFDDPFASPSPPSSPKKRKEPASQGLGIDEEVSVQKRARVPNVKLDEERLLGPAGLPKLRQRARDLKLKGKGHEFSDASRLLSFYQMWLDDLFPKAKFLDALAMVEKAGHKKRVVAARNEFMNEGKPKPREEENADFGPETDAAAASCGDKVQPTRPAQGDRPATPIRMSDVPDDDDLYGATPRSARRQRQTDVPDDEDDLDALIAEAEGQDRAPPPSTNSIASQSRSVDQVDEEDDLDALIAEAETRDGGIKSLQPPAPDDTSKGDFTEEEAAMQEMDELW